MLNKDQMMILRCKVCGSFSIPPKYLCTKCGHESPEEYSASGLGRIYTFTTIYVAPELFKNQVPYDIAIFELDEGIRVTGRVEKMYDSPLKIGDSAIFQRKDKFGYWFKIKKNS